MDSTSGMGELLIVLVIAIVVFFIFRKLVLWYWKLDKIEEHLSAIRVLLERQNEQEGMSSVSSPTSSKKKVNPKSAMKNFEPLPDEPGPGI